MKKFNFLSFQNENPFSSLGGKSFSLKNKISSFTVPNNEKLKNYFLKKLFSHRPNTTLKQKWVSNLGFIVLLCQLQPLSFWPCLQNAMLGNQQFIYWGQNNGDGRLRDTCTSTYIHMLTQLFSLNLGVDCLLGSIWQAIVNLPMVGA